jgi:peptidoglycan hydrolase-like protein with peptidoglycan-binding domain
MPNGQKLQESLSETNNDFPLIFPDTKNIEHKPIDFTHEKVMPVDNQDPTLQLGSQGDDVKHLQEDLNLLKYGPLTVDGDFGPKTQAAVERFQSNNNLAVDGIVGPQTWQVLHEQAARARRAS